MHFLNHAISAKPMIRFVHLAEVLISIGRNRADLHIPVMILDKLHPKKQHCTGTVCIPFLILVSDTLISLYGILLLSLLLLLQKPDDIPEHDWQGDSICL